jgi:hypothetical protein
MHPRGPDHDTQRTIAVNYLTSERPLWYTLADAVASKLLTGRAPKIDKALRFTRRARQENLRPVSIAGNPDYTVDPATEDFFKRLIDLRQEVQAKEKIASGSEKDRLESEQKAIKICANATSYGIYVEVQVHGRTKEAEITVHGYDGRSYQRCDERVEQTGEYFHPLLATLITGAARLMLAITERLATDGEIDWAFCDTDSMALAKPDDMTETEFRQGACASVIDWFEKLNPYEKKGSLLKVEDENYRIVDGRRSKTDEVPLYAYAVSAKRYSLFNIVDSHLEFQKISSHGLGHLLSPYDDKPPPDGAPRPALPLEKLGSGVRLWHHELWYRIVKAVQADSSDPGLYKLKRFRKAAAIRYGAMTPNLLKWFKDYNTIRPFREQVRPFGFLLSYQTTVIGDTLKPVSPYDRDSEVGASKCFDRSTGQPVERARLADYASSLAQYHLHSEYEFLNGHSVQSGVTLRRHIRAKYIEHIGKEGDKLEETSRGYDPDAVISYGMNPADAEHLRGEIEDACRIWSSRSVAKASEVNHSIVVRMLRGQSKDSETLLRLSRGVIALRQVEKERNQLLEILRDQVASRGVALTAAALGEDRSNLAAVLVGRRQPTKKLLDKLSVAQ